MPLQKERLRECMKIFFLFFNIPKNYEYKSIPITDIMPFLEDDIGSMMLQNDEQSEAILWWLSQAYYYIIGDIDEMPLYELDYSDFEKSVKENQKEKKN